MNGYKDGSRNQGVQLLNNGGNKNMADESAKYSGIKCAARDAGVARKAHAGSVLVHERPVDDGASVELYFYDNSYSSHPLVGAELRKHLIEEVKVRPWPGEKKAPVSRKKKSQEPVEVAE